MAVQTYNPADVRIVIAGYVVSGFADSNSIRIERNQPALYNAHVGSQGEVSRTATTDRTAKLIISLKATAPFNTQMQLIANTLNAAKFPVSVQNKSDLKYKGGSSEAWIESLPNKELGQDEQMREYTIFMADFSEKEG